MLKKIIILIISILFSTQIFAQETHKKMRYSGYSGGMLLNTGYLFGGNYELNGETKSIQGVPFGIGGAMKFCFGKHLRVGFEGYTTNLGYNANGSSVNLGWGGILADCKWNLKNITLFVGLTFGGGTYKHILNTEEQDTGHGEDVFFLRKTPVMLGVPFAGIEFSVSPRISIVAKIDMITYLSHLRNDFVKGPRLYLGFLFQRQK
ncbi:MAG: hypothetical protein LBP67_01605 [Bacteroidales bacterium]|jgi:hypothetical protein|nr:hypothetical protein [Bacteroidales bacterium]